MLNDNFYVVGVGASAGGFDALQRFFKNIPTDINAAFVVVTHLYPDYRSHLDNLLGNITALNVVRISGGEDVTPATIYVMPENSEVTIRNKQLHLEPRKSRPGNHAIDTFFLSLAVDLKHRAIGMILSGGGQDGAAGANYIHAAGGSVYVQDPDTTQFSYMPRAAISLDHPDIVESPEILAQILPSILADKNLKDA